MAEKNINPWTLICYSGDGKKGCLSALIYDGEWRVRPFLSGDESSLPAEHKPILLTAEQDNVLLLDPVSKAISAVTDFPRDTFPAYAYLDAENARMWYMNDGDKDTGNDGFNCGDKGASVTVVAQQGAGSRWLKTLCVGRGHHVTTFVGSSAFVSNLIDGTISVVGNNAADEDDYLNVIATINLFDAQYESVTHGNVMQPCIPNNAFPHGMVYSSHTGKLYNLNNGYHSIAVIDPVKRLVEERIPMPVSSNLLGSYDGKFLIGKGVDRKSDAEHVIGYLPIFDVDEKVIVNTIILFDIYPSTYRFNASGSKLYVTTATTGKGVQRDNVKTNLLYIFDTSDLPNMPILNVLEVGECQCGRRPIALTAGDLDQHYVFVPNLTDGTVTVISEASNTVIETLALGEKNATEFAFSFWQSNIYGA